MLYVWANFHADVLCRPHDHAHCRRPHRGERLRVSCGHSPHRSCRPTSCTARARRISRRSSISRRAESFRKIVERHPNSTYAPRARFLIGEAFYREAEFDKAIKEFDIFLAFYPRHQIADLVQYRLAMSYYDQIKPIEQDQGLTAKALDQFKKLVKEYPDSRYATEALAKIDICRGRLAQKEVWVATYYFNQGNPSAARQRLEFVLKEYPRTLVIPETLYTLADVNFAEGKTQGRRRAAPAARLGLLVHRVGTPGRPASAHDRGDAVHDVVDLRSDTLTRPTPEMREAMARAEVGDDVWDEDPTVKRLEAMAAERLGKEAALFVTSGTMGNLVSVLAQTQSGQEVVLDLDSHIFNYEVGGSAVIGGVQMRPAEDRARLPHAGPGAGGGTPGQHPHPADRPGVPGEHAQPPRRHLLHAGGDRRGGRGGPRRRRAASISTARGSSTPRSRSGVTPGSSSGRSTR